VAREDQGLDKPHPGRGEGVPDGRSGRRPRPLVGHDEGRLAPGEQAAGQDRSAASEDAASHLDDVGVGRRRQALGD